MAEAYEVATRRKVEVLTGADGQDGTVVYRYAGETFVRTISREAFFLCGRFIAWSPDLEATR